MKVNSCFIYFFNLTSYYKLMNHQIWQKSVSELWCHGHFFFTSVYDECCKNTSGRCLVSWRLETVSTESCWVESKTCGVSLADLLLISNPPAMRSIEPYFPRCDHRYSRRRLIELQLFEPVTSFAYLSDLIKHTPSVILISSAVYLLCSVTLNLTYYFNNLFVYLLLS